MALLWPLGEHPLSPRPLPAPSTRVPWPRRVSVAGGWLCLHPEGEPAARDGACLRGARGLWEAPPPAVGLSHTPGGPGVLGSVVPAEQSAPCFRADSVLQRRGCAGRGQGVSGRHRPGGKESTRLSRSRGTGFETPQSAAEGRGLCPSENSECVGSGEGRSGPANLGTVSLS